MTLSILKKRPGWVYKYGNAWYNATAPVANSIQGSVLAVRRMGGITTWVKTIEFVGETINDATAFPDTTIFNAPTVIQTQDQAEFEIAKGGSTLFNYVGGDPVPPLAEAGLTGQPWNYMFPTPSSSSSLGTSAVIGALTSGL